MSRTISSSDNTIDSRDVIARIEELRSERETLSDVVNEAIAAETEYDPPDMDGEQETDDALDTLKDATETAKDELAEWDNGDEAAELKALESLQEDAGGYAPDWHHGAALISDDYFEDYAREFADDIGAINRDAGWPNNCIDWERAAAELQQDYTSVDFDGATYWVRS